MQLEVHLCSRPRRGSIREALFQPTHPPLRRPLTQKTHPQNPGARGRLAKLPDEERRSAAGALALRFASMLGGSSDGEEGDGDDGV
jgi:hypothetical protein